MRPERLWICIDGWFGKLFRTKILARVAAFAMTREKVRKLALRIISQIGIRYRNSPLSQTLPGLPKGAPVADDRFPWLQLKFQANAPAEDLYGKLDDTRYNLLVIGQFAPSTTALRVGELLAVHAIPDDAHNANELTRAGITGICVLPAASGRSCRACANPPGTSCPRPIPLEQRHGGAGSSSPIRSTAQGHGVIMRGLAPIVVFEAG